MDKYERIFLSFGEIDCREDEGILKHCENREKVETISKLVATSYYEWTQLCLSQYRPKVVYFGTPAPFRSNIRNYTSKNGNNKRLIAIKTFNDTLAELCKSSRTPFADVYKLTADTDGYNNKKWMIDSCHLSPKALKELISRL